MWGDLPDGNASWTGSIGEIHRDESDIMVSNLYVSEDRSGIVDYSTPYKTEVMHAR